MLTKGAIGNLINRYRAVLKKCNLINTFGSLAVASMLVMGGAGVANATITLNGETLATPVASNTVFGGDTIVGSGSDVLDLVYEDGGQPISAYGNGTVTSISGLSSLAINGTSAEKIEDEKPVPAYNAICAQGGTVNITNVKDLSIGNEKESAYFYTGIHGFAGKVDIDLTGDLFVNSWGNAVFAQAHDFGNGEVTIDAQNITLTGKSGASAYYTERHGDVNVELNAKGEINIDTARNALNIFNEPGYRGEANISLHAGGNINLSTSTAGVYTVNVNRSAEPTDEQGVKSKLSVISDTGNISITGPSYGLRVNASYEDADVSAELTALNGKVSITSTESTGVYLQNNADLTISAADVEINAATKGVDAFAGDIDLLGNVAVATKGENAGQAINLQGASHATIGGEGKTVTLSSTQEAGKGSGVIRPLTIGASTATIEGDVSISSYVANANQWSIGVDLRDYDRYGDTGFIGDASLTFSGNSTDITAGGDINKIYAAAGVQAISYNNKKSEVTFSADNTTIDVTSRHNWFVNGVIAEGKGASVLFNGENASVSIENLGYTAQGVNGYGGGIVTFDGTKATVSVQSDVGTTGILGSFESGSSSPYGLIQLKNGAEVTVNTYIIGDGIAGAGSQEGKQNLGSMEEISVAEGSTLNINVHGAGLWPKNGDMNNTAGTAGLLASKDTTIDGTVNISVVAGQDYKDMNGNQVVFSTEEIGKYDDKGVSYSDARGIHIYGSDLKAGDASQINISVSEGYSKAYGIAVQDGSSLGVDYPVEDVNLLNAVNITKVEGKSGAYGIALNDKAVLEIAGKTTISEVTSSAGEAYGLYLTEESSASFDDLEIASVTGKVGSYGISLDSAGTSLTLGGTTSINATATDAANAHALYGVGAVTNSGALTVKSGKLSGFTGTYTQTAGSTNILGATDFFGGKVTISAGSLTVDAAKLGEKVEKGKYSQTELQKVFAAGVAAATIGGNLIVDFATLAKAHRFYSLEDYETAQKALLNGDSGKLVFLNASLEELEDDSASLVVGAGAVPGKEGEFELAGNPTIVTGNETPEKSTESIPSVPTEVVQLVDNEEGNLLQPKALKIDNKQLAVKSIQVAAGADNIDLNIGVGSDMTFTGAPVVDETGAPVLINPTVQSDAVVTIGMVGVKDADEKPLNFGDTEIHGVMNLVDRAAMSKNLTIHHGGVLFLDPTYKYAENMNTLAGTAVVGEGSVFQIGAIDDLKSMVEESGFEAVASGENFVVKNGAVLALGKAITLGETGQIVVDGSLSVAGSNNNITLDPSANGQGSAFFADDSLLVVTDSVASAGAITSTTQNANGAAVNSTLVVESGAKLYIADAIADETYTIASGFATITDGDQNAPVTELDGWNGNNLIVNRLLAAETTIDDDSVIVTTKAKSMEEAMPGALAVAALSEMAEVGMGDGSKAGQVFLGKAIDPTVIADTGTAVDVINEVSRAAVTAGVQNTSLRIADAASNTVLSHMSLAQHDGSKAIHADGVDFWAAPMYGNLYTSGMVTSGSSVRGQFGGLALGADVEAGKVLGGQFRLGAAINGGGGQSETKGNVTSTQNDYDFGGLNVYAAWTKGAMNVIGSIGYGFGNHEVEMGMPSSMAMGSAKADIDTTSFTADLRAEYQLKTDWVDLMPHVGVRYTALRTNSHDLKIGGNVLNSVERDTQNIVQFPIGVTLSKDFTFADWTVKPMADVSVIPAAGNKEATTKVNFSGLDAWDSVNTRIMDSTSWAGTVGVQAEKGNMSFGLNYGVQASSNETDQNVQVKFGWKF